MEEVVYSAESQLRSPARFAAETWADLRVSPRLAWRLFPHSLRANYRRSWLGYLWLLAPPGVAALLLLGVALGLLLTPVGLLYQDVSRGLALAVGFWFFLTPVIYPWPSAGRAALLARLNPVAPLLEATRGWLTTGRAASAHGFLLVVALTLPVLLTAWLLQRLARPHIIARLG